MPHHGPMRRRSRLVLWCLLPVLGLGLSVPAEAGPAPVGKDRVVPGKVYGGDFPDPSVLRVGGVYYAYATNTSGLNVPVLFSTNLSSWRAVPGTSTNPTGDALPRTAVWSAGTERSDGRFRATTWAPSVNRLRNGRYVMAYATQVAGQGSKMCISVATSMKAAGPFVDRTTRPTICPPRGAIDPQIWLAPDGRPWIYWKVDRRPAQLYVTRMEPDGTTITNGARNSYALAAVKQSWEGTVVENPSMIRYQGRYYLFYSANAYTTSKYATGYLICKTWYSGCKRAKKPLLKSKGDVAGPGGATAFTDPLGRLRLGYHAWRKGAVGYSTSTACLQAPAGCGQRRLHVVMLKAAKDGTLSTR